LGGTNHGDFIHCFIFVLLVADEKIINRLEIQTENKMKTYSVKINSIDHVTHDTLKIITEKPHNYNFIPGQATDVSINKNGWEDEKRPFTFTSLPENDHLAFVIKTYPSHEGVTNEMLKLGKNDELILRDVYGAITYKGEGVFIAGGAGVTPFISIFRNLGSKKEIGNNKLIFGNKTKKDIILAPEFEELLGKNFINILSDEETREYAHGFITKNFLEKYFDNSVKNVYLCGPPPMMELVKKELEKMGVDKNAITEEGI
jgi:predicted ferric reductase